MLLAISLGTAAHAFCGTYVGADGDELSNSASQVVLARQGERTTTTVAVNFTGNTGDFALLLPVPALLGEEDVRVIDPQLIEDLATYSTPRGVSYTCDDVYRVEHPYGSSCTMMVGCSYSSDLEPNGAFGFFGEDAQSTVEVQDEFTVAVYDIVILSAEESRDLTVWLNANGYALPAGGADILQEYIDAGVYFLAAKVTLEEQDSRGLWLPPLQFTYESEVFSLPIRIGTISAEEEQEVVIYALTDAEEGSVGISNYPEVVVEDECMFDSPDSLGDYYNARFVEATDDEPSWSTEFSWDLTTVQGGYHCDPCTAVSDIPPEDLWVLGYGDGTWDSGGWWDSGGASAGGAHLTRLRMRYRPDEVGSDLVLYTTGITGQTEQIRYIEYNRDLEFAFPVCDEGFRDDPGQCEVSNSDNLPACGLGLQPAAFLAFMASLVATRRRR